MEAVANDEGFGGPIGARTGGGNFTTGEGRGSDTWGCALSPSYAGWPAIVGGGGDGEPGRSKKAFGSSKRISRLLLGKNLEPRT